MIGSAKNSKTTGRANGLRISQSVYGTAVPLLYGRYRATPKLIWAGNFQAHKQSGGKKGGGGKGKGGGGSNFYNYSAAADWLIAHYPQQQVLSGWNNKDRRLVLMFAVQYTVASGQITIAPPGFAGAFLGVAGVYLNETYSASFNDFGGDGSLSASGSWKRPLWNAWYYAPDAQPSSTRSPYIYNWHPGVGTTVFFDSSLNGKVVDVWYFCQYGTQSARVDIMTALNLDFETFLASGSEYATAPSQKVPYNWVSGVGSPNFDLGSSDSFPAFSLEVQGAYNLWPDGGCDPADILTDLFTSGKTIASDSPYTGQAILIGHGLNLNSYTDAGLPLPMGDWLGDLTGMRNYCQANKISCSMYLDSQVAARDVFQELLDVANCAPVWSGNQLKVIPYSEVSVAANGAIYTAPTASGPICTLDDRAFTDTGGAPVEVDRSRQADASNVVTIQHVRDNSEVYTGDYNDDVTYEVEQASVRRFGPRPDNPRQMRSITKKTVAQKVASVLVKRAALQRNNYRFSLPVTYSFLEPMDLVAITDAGLGLSSTPVRIQSVKESFDSSKGWLLAIEAEAFIYGLNAPTPMEVTTASPYIGNTNANPGDVNEPIFVEPPDALENNGYWLWIALSGSNANWGGCVIWMSTDGLNYTDIGQITTPTAMGVLSANLASHADPDDTNTLSVDLTESGGTMDSVSSDDKDALRSLIWFNGELGAYQDATATGASLYDLTSLRRGAYGTPIAAHLAGTEFALLDDRLFRLKLDTNYVGRTLHFKFCSFNTKGGGAQSIDEVSDWTYTFQGKYNNFVQIIGNDSIITTGYSGSAFIHITGGGSPVAAQVTLYKSDGSNVLIGPGGGIPNITSLSALTDYYALYNPGDASFYATSDYGTMLRAVYNGHVLLGSCTTPDSGGSGGSGGGGGGGFGGGCPEVSMFLGDGVRVMDGMVGTFTDALRGSWVPAEPDDYEWFLTRWLRKASQWWNSVRSPILWRKLSWEECYLLVTEEGHEIEVSESTPVATLENRGIADVNDRRIYACGVSAGEHVIVDEGEGTPKHWSKLALVRKVGRKLVARLYIGGLNFAAGRDPKKRIYTHNSLAKTK